MNALVKVGLVLLEGKLLKKDLPADFLDKGQFL